MFSTHQSKFNFKSLKNRKDSSNPCFSTILNNEVGLIEDIEISKYFDILNIVYFSNSPKR